MTLKYSTSNDLEMSFYAKIGLRRWFDHILHPAFGDNYVKTNKDTLTP